MYMYIYIYSNLLFVVVLIYSRSFVDLVFREICQLSEKQASTNHVILIWDLDQ